MVEDPWKKLNIPHDWAASDALRNLVVDYLGPNKDANRPIDDDARRRMAALSFIGHIELVDKVTGLIARVDELEKRLGERN